MTAVVFGLAIGAGALAALWPWLGPRVPHWPDEPAAAADDVARAVSSLRDLQFAEAAGTIDGADAARLRGVLERSAFAPPPARAARRAPIRTIGIAALLIGLAAALAAQSLPQAAGDRAPGEPITGTLPQAGPTIADLEARVKQAPTDTPTLLALADAYRQNGRTSDAVATYRTVLGIDANSVPALNGLALILAQAGQPDGAMVAVDRVLALRPKDPDGLFLKGLLLYQKGDWQGAVDVWTVYLDVGEFHPAAPMVRSLYQTAKANLGR
ncbi:MAG TPA: tetratricopeptide repeat protein [Candidatus Limnocylindria bacterium]|nr:tetratricopeptide repeat protein [Candidatus Limnocylindria bacterium]